MGRFVKSLGAGELRELVQAKESGDEDSGTGAGAIAGIGLAGLLVGLVGGGFAARRR